MPLSNTSTTKLDNFDGNRRSARKEEGGQSWPMNPVGNSLPTFHQVFPRQPCDPTTLLILIFYPNQMFFYTRAYTPETFCIHEFLSFRDIIPARENTDTDSRIFVRVCVLLPPPVNKYANVSATTSYCRRKNDKEGYRLSRTC